MARLTLAKTALQTAVDEAALAGAAAYQSGTQAGTGTAAATTYFNTDIATMGGLVTINSVTVTPAIGTNAAGFPSYNISVSVSATMSYSLMTVMNLKTATLTAQATAANPMVQPVITVGTSSQAPGTGTASICMRSRTARTGSPTTIFTRQ